MPKYINYDYNQTKFVPISYDKQIVPGSFEYTLSYIIDQEMNLSVFDSNYKNDERGRPAWDPAIMLKIILYAYSRGITSSRKIAQACTENVIFMALSADSQPHFTSISNFVTSMENQILCIFQDVVYICAKLGLIGGDMFAIDGCKISSNASKEWSGSRKELKNKIKKIKKTIKYLLQRHKKQDNEEGKAVTKPRKDDDRIDKMKQEIKKIRSFLKENDERQGSRGRENKSNITDNESAKLKSSHGFIQGYNGLSIADAKRQVVVSAGAWGTNDENALLEDMVMQARDNMVAAGKGKRYFKGKKFLGDTGYFSESTLAFLKKIGINAYIPDNLFRHRDPRFATAHEHKKKTRKFTQDDFVYNSRTDTYTCPAKKKLRLVNANSPAFGDPGRRYAASETDCGGCKLKSQCLKTEDVKCRTYWISHKMFYGELPLTTQMKERIDSRRGRNTYSKRMGIIEPVFANIRWAKGLNRFTLRGRKKVNIQWMLYNLVHNIGKINSFGRRKCAIA